MPYISPDNRKPIDEAIDGLIAAMRDYPTDLQLSLADSSGAVNYTLTRILLGTLLRFHSRRPRYQNLNAALGVLECIKQELYRRMVAPYEGQKLQENGDVFPD